MRATQCDFCNYWNHIKCDGVDEKTYEKLKKSKKSETHMCKICKEDAFAFQTLSEEQFCASIIHNVEIDEKLNLNINPSPRLKVFFDTFENQKNDNDTIN